jgi:hypothetical protein
MSKKDKQSIGNTTWERQDDDAAEGGVASAKHALDDLAHSVNDATHSAAQSVTDAAHSVGEVGEKGARAAASAKQLVADRAHSGAVALRRRRRQALAMLVAGISLGVATIARRMARRA